MLSPVPTEAWISDALSEPEQGVLRGISSASRGESPGSAGTLVIVSQILVTKAKGTNHGVALEYLKAIRK